MGPRVYNNYHYGYSRSCVLLPSKASIVHNICQIKTEMFSFPWLSVAELRRLNSHKSFAELYPLKFYNAIFGDQVMALPRTLIGELLKENELTRARVTHCLTHTHTIAPKVRVREPMPSTTTYGARRTGYPLGS